MAYTVLSAKHKSKPRGKPALTIQNLSRARRHRIGQHFTDSPTVCTTCHNQQECTSRSSGYRMEVRRAVRRRNSDRGSATSCPLTAALQVVGGRWSMITLYWLDQGPQRFSELRRRMPSISHNVLAANLRDLEREGLAGRTVIPAVPPKVEYAISDYGRTVRPLIEATREWGRLHLMRQADRANDGK